MATDGSSSAPAASSRRDRSLPFGRPDREVPREPDRQSGVRWEVGRVVDLGDGTKAAADLRTLRPGGTPHDIVRQRDSPARNARRETSKLRGLDGGSITFCPNEIVAKSTITARARPAAHPARRGSRDARSTRCRHRWLHGRSAAAALPPRAAASQPSYETEVIGSNPIGRMRPGAAS